MVAADHAPGYARKLGIQRDQVVQEWGWDEDTDDDIRAAVEEACGGELLDEDTDEVVDVVLLWWRDGDGDLVDTLMDAITPLAEDGVIWVLTPKTGKPGHVLPAEIAEAAPTAGLMPTSSVNLGDWSASRLVQPKSRRREALMLPVGTAAPDFTLRDQNQQPVTLSAYRGAKNVLLVFFPLAFTGICQGELDAAARPPAGVRERRQRGAGHLGGAAAHPQDLGDRERLPVSGALGLLAARRGQPGLRRVQRRRRLSPTAAPSSSTGRGSFGSPR